MSIRGAKSRVIVTEKTTCSTVLDRCIKTAKKQNKAIQSQKVVINKQDRLMKGMKKDIEKKDTAIGWLTVGNILGILLLL